MNRLADAQFRRGFGELTSEVTSFASLMYSDPIAGFEHLRGNWWGSVELAMDSKGWIPDILEERTAALGNPRIVARFELWDEFKVYLHREDAHITEEMYDAYLDHIEHRLLAQRESLPFAVCEVAGLPRGADRAEYFNFGAMLERCNLLGNLDPDELREAADRLAASDAAPPLGPALASCRGFSLGFARLEFAATQWRIHAPDPEDLGRGILHVALAGRCSPRALELALADVVPLVQSQFRSIALLESRRCNAAGADGLPSIAVKELLGHWSFAGSAIEMAVLQTSNKDTFERRIANAVRLLAEADSQRSDPIGLALSVTAIDALLGKKGQEGTNKLADFVATFLEPDVSMRRLAADFVVDVYDKRSRVLHGERLHGDSELRGDVRHLAACLLYAVWAHQDWFERFYEKADKPEDMFERTRQDFVKPGMPMGVLETPARKLWQGELGEAARGQR